MPGEALKRWLNGSRGIGLASFLFGAFVLALSWSWSVGTFQLWQEERLLGEAGAETGGIVLDRRANGNTSYLVSYEYEAIGTDGATALFRQSDYVDRATYLGAAAGSSLTVRYLPADPAVAMVVGNRWVQDTGPFMLAGTLMSVLFLLVGAYFLIFNPDLKVKGL